MSRNDEKRIRIKIIKGGPYLVSGNVPLSKKCIVPRGKNNEYQHIMDFPIQENYALCRCGRSQNPPYCDGSHVRIGFIGKEIASRADYADRAQILEGPDLDLLDDGRCAYARFCHRNDRSVWELTENSDDPRIRNEAIRAASDCPTGRLVAIDLDGNPIEPVFEPSIEILEDNAENVSGPLFVKGYIPIESADGFTYEVRNRVALCRCGKSSNTPFCDATHVSVEYRDKR
jgi:CDGSH-type Zn-finger protein